MGSEAMIEEASSAPTLSLFSLPKQSPEPQGMLTPPLRPPASVPFLWEEAPGKPRSCNETDSKTKSSSARCLELPPRLLISESSKMTNMSSPTTVLEGPYIIGRSASYSLSFGRDRYSNSSSRSPPDRGGQSERVLHLHGKSKEYSKERNGGGGGGGGYFGSWGRKQSLIKGRNEEVGVEDNFVISRSATVSCSSSLLSHGSVLNGGEEGKEKEKEEETRVKITRFRRKGSFLSLSATTRSHFWANVYGTLKQVVPWRRTSNSSSSSSSSSRRNKRN